MKAMERRIAALEGNGVFYTIGELLDSLDGEPLDPAKTVDPVTVAALDALPWTRLGQ